MRHLLLPLLAAATGAGAVGPGYWPLDRAAVILDKTQDLRLAPDLTALTGGERRALERLLEVGGIFQRLYEDARHPQAVTALRELEALHQRQVDPARTGALLRLYRLNQGPIATTLDNDRQPFVPVGPPTAARNVYPPGVERAEIDAFLAAHPSEREQILHPRTVVRRADEASLARDLGALQRHPVLDTLHPGLRARLSAAPAGRAFYAAPYAVAYADDLVKAYHLLAEAADAVQTDDAEFAGYLRNRARDLLTNDYESGDASWVTARFGRLNAQLGAYETYDDELYGVKAFFAASLLLRDEAESKQLRSALSGLQALQDALPVDVPKRVRDGIPVGVYDVIADFGQARGTNTATILPNEAYLAQRYGRTILLRANIMRHPEIFAASRETWRAGVTAPFEADLAEDGDFYRTLWHEVGHYLGVDRDRQGRDLDAALQEDASALEEMKSDLVSLFVARGLHGRGYYSDARLRSVYASGVRRTLQNVRPRRDQPYQTMQLVQMNYFLENGLLSWDRGERGLVVHYDRYHEVVGRMLREVLAVQHTGEKSGSDQFLRRYSDWRDDLHGVVASRMRDATRYRFRLVRYAALGE